MSLEKKLTPAYYHLKNKLEEIEKTKNIDNIKDTILRQNTDFYERFIPPILEDLKNSPQVQDYKTLLNNYTTEVRKVQDIVREKVNLRLSQTETDGAKFEHLFDTDNVAVNSGEFQRWGVIDPFGSCMPFKEFGFLGHLWVTVWKAEFKSQYRYKGEKILEDIRKIKENLIKLYEPIEEICRKVDRYDYDILFKKVMFCCADEIFQKERAEFKTFEKQFKSDTNFIRKGIISLSMIFGLIYHLEESLKNHPGD